MRISDWSSDVCSSDLGTVAQIAAGKRRGDFAVDRQRLQRQFLLHRLVDAGEIGVRVGGAGEAAAVEIGDLADALGDRAADQGFDVAGHGVSPVSGSWRSEEHTSELQSLMRISYAVFCLKKKKTRT